MRNRRGGGAQAAGKSRAATTIIVPIDNTQPEIIVAEAIPEEQEEMIQEEPIEATIGITAEGELEQEQEHEQEHEQEQEQEQEQEHEQMQVVVVAGEEETVEDKNLSFFLSYAQSLDSMTLLSAVGQRLFDHFTMFDLLLTKGKLNPRVGILNSAVDDMSIMMMELKMLIEGCLSPVQVGNLSIKKKSEDCIEIDPLLTYAMGMENNIWLKRQPKDVRYNHRMFDVDVLHPPVSETPKGIATIRVKKEIDESQLKGENKENKEDGSSNKKKKKEDGESEEEEEDEEGSPKKKEKREGEEETPKKKKKKYRPRQQVAEERARGDFVCGKCNKGYLNSTAWYKHMETTCASKASLRISIRTVGDKYFCAFKNCHTPKRPFRTKDDVHDHWALHHVEEDQKIFPCFMCKEKFATTGAQKLHMRTTHMKERLEKAAAENPKAIEKVGNKIIIKKKITPRAKADADDDQKGSKEKYLCLKCGQSLNKATGKKHEEKCTGMQVRRPEYKKVNDEYFCTVHGCTIGYGFSSNYGLNKHFHTVHTREEEKFFSCDYCDEKFSFNTTRNKHMAEKHLKNYVCDLCGKGFGGKSKLNTHRMLHTGEKPYACNRCDYRAAKKCNYEAHMESKHGVFQQKNFVCAVCNKQFQTMGRIRHHMELVHSEKDMGEEEQKEIARRRKRHKVAPPVEKQLSRREAKKLKKVPLPPAVPISQQPQQQQQIQYVHNPEVEQDAAVQYIQAELGQGDERVITIRPLY